MEDDGGTPQRQQRLDPCSHLRLSVWHRSDTAAMRPHYTGRLRRNCVTPGWYPSLRMGAVECPLRGLDRFSAYQGADLARFPAVVLVIGGAWGIAGHRVTLAPRRCLEPCDVL